MVWQPPQLATPRMVSPEIQKINRRLLLAYSTASKARELGVTEQPVFDEATHAATINFQRYVNEHKLNSMPLRTDGVADYATRVRMGVLPAAPSQPAQRRFSIQGVGYSTDAFLMGDPTHSYVNACDEAVAEMNKLAGPDESPKVVIGYSMGDDAMNQWLHQWPADRRHEVKMVVGFGPPSRRPGPTLLGNNPPGVGISGLYTPDWADERTFQFILEGDMYGCAVGLLPQLYKILVRLEASIEFAAYLFGILTSSFGPALLGLTGAVVPGFGALAPILGLVTPGLPSSTKGEVNLMAMIANIPAIVQTLVAALKFVQTNAHYHYHDQPQPYWGGMTAVDWAADLISRRVSTARVYLFPGTVSHWNDGPPAWTSWKLP